IIGYMEVFYRTEFSMCFRHLGRKHINVHAHHFERRMSEYFLQVENVCAILYGHLRKGMTECVRTVSYVRNSLHSSVFSEPILDGSTAHLLVLVRNEQIRYGRLSTRL